MTFYANLPLFTGFYSGYFNHLIENEEELLKDDYPDDDIEVDYTKTKDNISKACVEEMQNIFDELGITDKIEFESIDNPKYYNYSTDKIIVKIDIEDSEKWLSDYRKYIGTEEFEKHIKENYTPCSGYLPYYSNDVRDWEKLFDDKNIEELWFPIMKFVLLQNEIDTEYLYICVSEYSGLLVYSVSLEDDFLNNLSPLLKAIYDLGGVEWDDLVNHTTDYLDPSSGSVGGLIYYSDTEPFAKDWHDEIIELMDEWGVEKRFTLNEMTWFTWGVMMHEFEEYKNNNLSK